MQYSGRSQARQWFKETQQGVCNITLPTFTSDLSRLDEAAIVHDIRRSVELGFEGTLIVSESGTTLEEFKQFVRLAVDAAAGEITIVPQASFDTAEDACEALRDGQEAGADAFLMGYPPSFRDATAAEVLSYNQQLCAATEMACILFTSPLFDLGHLHPSGFPLQILDDLLAIENVAAFKYEPIGPMAPALAEVHKLVDGAIPVVCPFDTEAPAFSALTGQRWLGTSVYQYAGDRVPKMWKLLNDGKYDDAMEIYWSLSPVRRAKAADKRTWDGANMLHRYIWKYYSWLNGYSGGLLRSPVMRLSQSQMGNARRALEASGIEPVQLPDSAFFEGRTIGSSM